jgi:hypothetical protein
MYAYHVRARDFWIPLVDRFASASRNVRSFANDLPIGMGFTGQPIRKARLPYAKTGSNASRKVLEKLADAAENREHPKN